MLRDARQLTGVRLERNKLEQRPERAMEQDQLLIAPMLVQALELAVRRCPANQRYVDKPKPGMVPFNLVPVSPLRTSGDS